MIWNIEADAQGITRIRDGRCGGADLLNGKGECGRILYTLREEDVRRLPKPDLTPHAQHTVLPAPTEITAERVRCEDAALGVTFELCAEGDALRLHWAYENRQFSQFAASLPLNFMSRKNGEWTAQLLVSSPWFDRESGRLLCLFTRPNGQHVGLVCETPVESFRIGYSSALFGHFFTDFEIHAVQDRVYGSTPRDRAELTAWLCPVTSYEELLQRAAALWWVPAAWYTRSDCRIGESFAVRVTPDCDTVRLYSPDGKCSVYPVSDGMAHIPAAVYGLYRMVPCRGETEGIGCIGFAHDDWRSLWRRSIDSVPVRREEVYAHTADGQPVWMPPTVTYRGYVDSNACEHTMWAWSRLLDSYNTFLSNFSKEYAAGNLYALWQCEPMISGAWEAADAVDRRYAVGFPHTKDITLSRYVFARAEETWFGCTALVRTEDGPQWLNGRIEDGRLVSDAPLFRTLYLDELSAPLRVEAAGELTVICAVPVRMTAGQLVCSDENGLHIRPDSDGIIGLAP